MNTTTNSGTNAEILSRQVAEWTRERDRLNGMIAFARGNAVQDSSPAGIAAAVQRLQGGPARRMAELMQGSAQDSSAPVPADERGPLNTLLQIAEFMESNSNQQQVSVDEWDYASKFDYELGHAAAEIRAIVADLSAHQAAPAQPATNAQAEQIDPIREYDEFDNPLDGQMGG